MSATTYYYFFFFYFFFFCGEISKFQHVLIEKNILSGAMRYINIKTTSLIRPLSGNYKGGLNSRIYCTYSTTKQTANGS